MSENNDTPTADDNLASSFILRPDEQDLVSELKRGLEASRLPADLKEQILANLPPPEEREKLFRELQEKGGVSSEEFLASLGLDCDGKP
jgi:hypothetical protein